MESASHIPGRDADIVSKNNILYHVISTMQWQQSAVCNFAETYSIFHELTGKGCIPKMDGAMKLSTRSFWTTGCLGARCI